MLFLLIGVLLLILKVAGVAPVSAWEWWWVLGPFGLAAVWWKFSDASGKTKRDQMRKLDDRKEARRQKQMEALGTHNPRRKR